MPRKVAVASRCHDLITARRTCPNILYGTAKQPANIAERTYSKFIRSAVPPPCAYCVARVQCNTVEVFCPCNFVLQDAAAGSPSCRATKLQFADGKRLRFLSCARRFRGSRAWRLCCCCSRPEHHTGWFAATDAHAVGAANVVQAR